MKIPISACLLITCLLAIVSCKSDKQKLSEVISAGENKLFSDSTGLVNDSAASAVLKHYLAFIDKYKDDTLTGEYLFKAAELENSLHSYKESEDLYEKLITTFPNHRKAAAALFMQAFIYDTGLHNPDRAKEKYKEFLDKYPGHQLAASAKSSFDQLNAGLSDEELVKIFEKQQDSLAKKNN